jgi:hypothetical protein
VNCDLVKERNHEAATELKWLRLIDKLLFEEINKTEVLGAACKYWDYKEVIKVRSRAVKHN